MNSVKSMVLSRFNLESLNGGAALRNGQTVAALKALGEVDLVSISEENEVVDLSSKLNSKKFPLAKLGNRNSFFNRARKTLNIFFSKYFPNFEGYLNKDAVNYFLQLSRQGVRYDLIVVEELALGAYIPHLKKIAKMVVFDAHNIEGPLRNSMFASDHLARKINWFKAAKERKLNKNVEGLERDAIQQSDLVWVCSDLDRKIMAEMYHANCEKVSVIPNTIDISAYEYKGRINSSDSWSKSDIVVMFIGSYSYSPNSQAALKLINEFMPMLWRRSASAQLILVGRSPTQRMELDAKGEKRIIITGSVDSVEPFLRRPCVLVMPIETGSGTRLKVLEGFAADRPIVSTSKAVEGIGAQHEKSILIANSVEEMVASVLRLWEDESFRKNICKEAYSLVAEKYSWQYSSAQIRNSIAGSLLN